ncbi:hypothetical protein WMY93_031896 [Mugilogobius chulae]|uniref:Uncharacterized protein n=1 Tax=Mugilogobius chulae TaxID=88201 RepID=A0AAW0MF42_9GOBI
MERRRQRDERQNFKMRRENQEEVPRRDMDVGQHLRELRGQRSKPNPDMMVITEETLTIKVDMSRPVNKNSAMLYSAEDRQLSLDLVHVGRQRLDFLSTAESWGANSRDHAAQHTGTFAQEIITLTHLVKDLYFGGEGITLNQRFSAPQRGGHEDEEPHGLTLSERFSSSRLNSNRDGDDSTFTRQGPLQLLGSSLVRDSDDLRHDLEKRRQERLEGVKVTIAGQNQSQRPQMATPVHSSEQMFGHDDEIQDEAEEVSNWSEEPHWRPDGPMQSPRRGRPFRSNGPFRRNYRQMRRPNYRHNNNNNGGPNW